MSSEPDKTPPPVVVPAPASSQSIPVDVFPTEPPTMPGAPRAKRALAPIEREGWGFEREGTDGPITRVTILCRGCLRPFKMCPPRFAVSEDGDVVASDEGAAFHCSTCDQPIGPLRLADWRLGRMGDP